MKTFRYEEKLKEFMSIRQPLQRILKDILHTAEPQNKPQSSQIDEDH